MKNEKPKLEKKWKIYIKEKNVESWDYESDLMFFGGFSLLVNHIRQQVYNESCLIQVRNEFCHDFVAARFGNQAPQELYSNKKSRVFIKGEIAKGLKMVENVRVFSHSDAVEHHIKINNEHSELNLALEILMHQDFKEKEAVYNELDIARKEFLWGVRTEFAPLVQRHLKTNWQDFHLIYNIFENILISSFLGFGFDDKKPIYEDYLKLKKAFLMRLRFLLQIVENATDLQPIVKPSSDLLENFIKIEVDNEKI